MPLLPRIGRRLARIRFVARAVEEHADLSMFSGRPPARLIVGVTLIGISMLVGGWPTLATIGVLAVALDQPWWGVIGVPGAYGLSWLIWGLGMILAGPDSVRYGVHFGRWAARVIVEWMLRGERP